MQKGPKPTLAGVNTRVRKRNIVHAFAPDQFKSILRDIVSRTHSNTDEFFREISQKEEQLDFHRYSTQFFDLLLCGGCGAGEGKLQQGTSPHSFSFFAAGPASVTDPTARGIRNEYIELVKQSLRRKPFLDAPLDQVVSNLLEAFVSFPEDFQRMTSILIGTLLARKVIPGKDLAPLLGNANTITSGAALRMLTEIFQTVLQESNLATLMQLLLDSGLLPRLLFFMPPAKQSQEGFEQHFTQAGMSEFVEQVRRRQSRDLTAQTKATLIDLIRQGKPVEEIVTRMQSLRHEGQMDDTQTMFLVWDAILGAIEWSSRSQQVAEQAQRQLTQWAPLLKPFVVNERAQADMMVRLQNHCYDDARCVKSFLPFVRILYDADVIEEDAIMYWYRTGSSLRGRSVFQTQLEPMIKWLETAEEEDDDDDDEGEEEEEAPAKPASKPAAK